jgi:hypothetical protein
MIWLVILTSFGYIFGDFNMVMHNGEKEGGNPIDYNSLASFRDTTSACNLQDLGYVGVMFTWHIGSKMTTIFKLDLTDFLLTQAGLLNFHPILTPIF